MALGGRTLNNPEIHEGLVYLPVANGWLHAVDLKKGEILWSYQTAPANRRIVIFGQVESAWPTVTAQLINGHLVVVAGRRDSFDQGIFVAGLDPKTGQKRWKQIIGVKKKHFDSVSEAKQNGYQGFGRKTSTHAFFLYKGEDDETYWMVGATPVKIPKTDLKPL